MAAGASAVQLAAQGGTWTFGAAREARGAQRSLRRGGPVVRPRTPRASALLHYPPHSHLPAPARRPRWWAPAPCASFW